MGISYKEGVGGGDKLQRGGGGGLIKRSNFQTAGSIDDEAFSADPQRSNAARVRNMSRLNGAKLPGSSKHLCKKSKDKAVSGKRSFKR